MSERFVEAFLDKLILLEQKAGAIVQYGMLPPFAATFQDDIIRQDIAKKIATFIGLTDFTPIVAVTRQKQAVGGHVDLSTLDKFIFIEINDELANFPDAVATVLCHEICHKWLKVHAINSLIDIDNEILTDITTVFLGLGKIMLNGCRTSRVRYEAIPNGTRSIVDTITAGYLDRDQLAFVYCLVCAMRGISKSESVHGLNAEATQAVENCYRSYGHYCSSHFRTVGSQREKTIGLTSQVDRVLYTMADLHKFTTYVGKSLCETITAFLKAGHKDIKSMRQKSAGMAQDEAPDPALRFLEAIKMETDIKRLAEQVRALSEMAEGMLQDTKHIARQLHESGRHFPSPSRECST